jgi:hypothetical protein
LEWRRLDEGFGMKNNGEGQQKEKDRKKRGESF